jgi:anaerobic selenocysteine-containing dehydrogenase
VRIASLHGEIELPVIVTKDIVAGVVAVPHGWGKGTGGWPTRRAEPTSTG